MGQEFNPFFHNFSVPAEEIIPDAIPPHVATLEAMARMSGKSLYIFDYHKMDFLHVSSGDLFLCGHTAEEVMLMGYGFFGKAVHEEDLAILNEGHSKGFELFYKTPQEERTNLVISSDFRLIQQGKRPIMVCHKLTPLLLTPTGKIWLTMCSIGLSTETKSGNVFIHANGELHRFIYSFAGRRWHKTENITLSEREKEVLRFSAEGYTNKEIGDKLCIDTSTVKFHKRNLFVKFNVKNITEAVTFAYNNWLL